MSEKLFPIQSQRGAAPHPTRIPWSVAELAYSVYSGQYGRGQSLERLAERGGFGPGEMDEFLPGWRERCEAIEAERRCEQFTNAEVDRLLADREKLKYAVRRLAEFHSAVSDVATRIGAAASPEWVKCELERALKDFRDMKGGA